MVGRSHLAGALIIDPTASRRLFGKKDHQNRLKKLANDPSPRNFLAHAFHTHRFLSARPSPQSFPFSNRLFKNALKELLSEQIIVKTTSGYALADWWLELIEISTSLISDYHKKNPDLPGLPLQDLRNALARPLKGHELFDEVIAALASEDIGQQREVLCAASHRTDIPPELAKEAETILSALQSGKLNPPTRKDLTPTPSSQRTLAFLVRTQQVLSLDNKTILHPTALDTACQLIRQHLEKNGRATASELRQVLNTSRRVCMPLLEHLDNIGLTQRKGDFRELL